MLKPFLSILVMHQIHFMPQFNVFWNLFSYIYLYDDTCNKISLDRPITSIRTDKLCDDIENSILNSSSQHLSSSKWTAAVSTQQLSVSGVQMCEWYCWLPGEGLRKSRTCELVFVRNRYTSQCCISIKVKSLYKKRNHTSIRVSFYVTMIFKQSRYIQNIFNGIILIIHKVKIFTEY